MPQVGPRRSVLLALAFAALAPTAARARSPALRQLLTAARRGDVAALRAALAAGAEVDGTDPSYEQTALIRAAMFGQAMAVRTLLAAGADPRRKAAPDGQQALHWAAVAGSPDAIQALLAAGVAADVTDGHGATPLDHALGAGQPESVTALLAGGADPGKLGRSLAFRIGPALNPDTPPGELEALRRAIRSGRGLESTAPHPGPGNALTALAERSNRPGAELLAADLVAAGVRLDVRDAQGRTAVQVIEQWLTTQRDDRYRAQMQRVLHVLRHAEARR